METVKYIIKIDDENEARYVFNKRTLVHFPDMAKRFVSTKGARKYMKSQKLCEFSFELQTIVLTTPSEQETETPTYTM